MAPYGPRWVEMVPDNPIWPHMVPYGHSPYDDDDNDYDGDNDDVECSFSIRVFSQCKNVPVTQVREGSNLPTDAHHRSSLKRCWDKPFTNVLPTLNPAMPDELL